ncbi:hypothetical protein XELAEV_18045660mg [Xenopus laevis]|uniref:G-protein coupled receptors family 1 profile domain-containing protein n=1 Tax=Xenopus laevis TaxID=8355 RepID=A0A974H4W2_XENLA|nr:hypothetical protein XELAEV_18045660mg [Xenopus laevis]
MKNRTTVDKLVLAGLSDLPSLQLPLFLVFLQVYLLTLTGNLLIILLIFTDSHLHSPMYFFLGTLACVDMSCSSVTVPRMLFDLLIEIRIISVRACITQAFFFFFFAVSEMSVLAVMSYDRYIAICRPLHYMQIMNWNVCVQLVSGVLVFSAIYSLVHTLFLNKLTFCHPNVLQSFFCDLPQLLEVSCSDTFINILLIFLIGAMCGVGILGVTFYPYISIITTLLKMTSKHMRSKAFSTCSSHLTVVFIFYTTIFFNYFRLNANDHLIEAKVASVFFAILTPSLNPVIYSLRNKELKLSLRRALKNGRTYEKRNKSKFFKKTDQDFMSTPLSSSPRKNIPITEGSNGDNLLITEGSNGDKLLIASEVARLLNPLIKSTIEKSLDKLYLKNNMISEKLEGHTKKMVELEDMVLSVFDDSVKSVSRLRLLKNRQKICRPN